MKNIKSALVFTFSLLFFFSCSDKDETMQEIQDVSAIVMKEKILSNSISQQEKVDIMNDPEFFKDMLIKDKKEFMQEMIQQRQGCQIEEGLNEDSVYIHTNVNYFLKILWSFDALQTTELTSDGKVVSTKSTGIYTIYGSHNTSGGDFSSKTSMDIRYDTNINQPSVVGTRVSNNPSGTWIQTSSGAGSFINNKSDVWARGTLKVRPITLNMKMSGWLTYSPV